MNKTFVPMSILYALLYYNSNPQIYILFILDVTVHWTMFTENCNRHIPVTCPNFIKWTKERAICVDKKSYLLLATLMLDTVIPICIKSNINIIFSADVDVSLEVKRLLN